MSTFDHRVIAERLAPDRLGSYLKATEGELHAALDLYGWNTRISAALYEDLGGLEVVFRNAVDAALVAHGQACGWPQVWHERQQMFTVKTWDTIEVARHRASRHGGPDAHGQVIADLNFGIWRFLCTPHYLTSLWVPALVGVFPDHPDAGDPRRVRADVEDRIQRLHFLRNRIAHHKPIHERDLARDYRELLEVVGWICADSRAWVESDSRTPTVLANRP